MLLNCGAGEDSWEFLGKQDQITQSLRKSTLNILWNDWCWSWSSNTLATWCKQLAHWKIPWYWERLKAGREEGDRGRDSWLASPIQWTWTWANLRRWWGTGKPGILQSLGLQRVGQDLAIEQQHHYPSWGPKQSQDPLAWLGIFFSCIGPAVNNEPMLGLKQRKPYSIARLWRSGNLVCKSTSQNHLH